MKKKDKMKTSSIVWIVVGVVALLLIISTIGTYNGFVSTSQNVDSRWSEVENQYQRQADLIPNLVSVVASAVSAETQFVKDVIAARTGFMSAGSQVEKDKAGVEMDSQVATFVNAVAEKYPELRANIQYSALTDELAGTQNRITVARKNYIEAIQSYNVKIKKFPSNILAGMFGFGEKEYYKADSSSMVTPSLGPGVLP